MVRTTQTYTSAFSLLGPWRGNEPSGSSQAIKTATRTAAAVTNTAPTMSSRSVSPSEGCPDPEDRSGRAGRRRSLPRSPSTGCPRRRLSLPHARRGRPSRGLIGIRAGGLERRFAGTGSNGPRASKLALYARLRADPWPRDLGRGLAVAGPALKWKTPGRSAAETLRCPRLPPSRESTTLLPDRATGQKGPLALTRATRPNGPYRSHPAWSLRRPARTLTLDSRLGVSLEVVDS